MGFGVLALAKFGDARYPGRSKVYDMDIVVFGVRLGGG